MEFMFSSLSIWSVRRSELRSRRFNGRSDDLDELHFGAVERVFFLGKLDRSQEGGAIVFLNFIDDERVGSDREGDFISEADDSGCLSVEVAVETLSIVVFVDGLV